MITIKISKENINTIHIGFLGHADYAKYGYDIVCASVSTLLIATVNYITEIDEKSISYKEFLDGSEIFISTESKVIKTIIDSFISMLEDLESQYPKNIKIIL